MKLQKVVYSEIFPVYSLQDNFFKFFVNKSSSSSLLSLDPFFYKLGNQILRYFEQERENSIEVISLLQEVTTQSGLPPSQLSKAISRISTEYRLQFAWPRRPQLTNGETVAPGVMTAGLPAGTTGPPRKSLSMGALKQGIAPTGPAPVHKKRPGDVDHKRDGKWNISTNL